MSELFPGGKTDWRVLSNRILKRKKMSSSVCFFFVVFFSHCPPSCKRLNGDGCRQRGTSVISISAVKSVFSNVRICLSVTVSTNERNKREGKYGGGLTNFK